MAAMRRRERGVVLTPLRVSTWGGDSLGAFTRSTGGSLTWGLRRGNLGEITHKSDLWFPVRKAGVCIFGAEQAAEEEPDSESTEDVASRRG